MFILHGLQKYLKKNKMHLLRASNLIFGCALLIAVSSFVAQPKLSAIGMICCALISVVFLWAKPFTLDKQDYFFIMTLLLYPAIASISLLTQHVFSLREFDTLLRFVLCVPVYLYLRKNPVDLKWFLYGAIVACISFAMTSLSEVYGQGMARADGDINAITYGQICIILSFYAALSMRLLPHDANHNVKLKMAVFVSLVSVMGLMASVLSGSRGPLLALPILAYLLLYAYNQTYRWKPIALVAVLSLAALLIVQKSHDVLRLNEAVSDIKALEVGQTNSSIGIRTEVWQASWILFLQKPILGHGKGRLIDEIKNQQTTLGVSDTALNYHAHNDYLQLLAELGVVGLASILLLYVGSIVIALRQNITRVDKVLVLAVCACWLTFGLTQVQLAHQRVTLLELLTLTFFMAYIKQATKIK